MSAHLLDYHLAHLVLPQKNYSLSCENGKSGVFDVYVRLAVYLGILMRSNSGNIYEAS
jgi:hypothetical protein